MVQIVFYEKPGCINNSRQKKLLGDAGHEVDARNLLTTNWTVDRLAPFFKGLAVRDWFNKTAPAVKSGDVIPAALDADAALALFVYNPLLIRRPLMLIENQRFVGFDTDYLNRLIGLGPITGDGDVETCPRTQAS